MEKQTFIELLIKRDPIEINEYLEQKGKIKLRPMVVLLDTQQTKKIVTENPLI